MILDNRRDMGEAIVAIVSPRAYLHLLFPWLPCARARHARWRLARDAMAGSGADGINNAPRRYVQRLPCSFLVCWMRTD